MSNLKLTDYAGNIYNFPESFWISDDSWSNNINVSKLFYTPGGRNISDGTLEARTITVSGILYADTLALFETAKRALMQACLKGGYLEKTVDAVSRYIQVRIAGVQTGQEENQQLQELSINFIAEYPMWLDSTETEDEEIVTGDSTLSVDTTGTDYLIQPIIEVEADQAVSVPAVKFTNNSDGGVQFNYVDTSFAIGDILTIDCEMGTVKLNNNDTIQYFTGAFFRLQPGVNGIEYEGNACTIRFKFRKAYL